MAKLHFYYSAMNAGKTTLLLQSSYNYRERGMDTLIFLPKADTRYESGKVTSRIGLSSNAHVISPTDHLFKHTHTYLQKNTGLHCVLIDEAQFLTKTQVRQLCDICDQLNIPVLAYGIRTDFQGEPFPGSLYLLAWADSLIELKTICYCGKKAIMNQRIDEQGHVVKVGDQIAIGGNEQYLATCRKHFQF